jgi:hypothetical protein
MCKACGGRVDADGYAVGGEVPSEEFEIPEGGLKEAEERDAEEGSSTEQQDSTEMMRNAAFVSAIKERRGRAPNPMGEPDADVKPDDSVEAESELAAKKRERYGWKKGA